MGTHMVVHDLCCNCVFILFATKFVYDIQGRKIIVCLDSENVLSIIHQSNESCPTQSSVKLFHSGSHSYVAENIFALKWSIQSNILKKHLGHNHNYQFKASCKHGFILKYWITWKSVRPSFRKYREPLPVTIFVSKVNFEVYIYVNKKHLALVRMIAKKDNKQDGTINEIIVQKQSPEVFYEKKCS